MLNLVLYKNQVCCTKQRKKSIVICVEILLEIFSEINYIKVFQFSINSLSAGRHIICCVSSSHVCSSGGSQRSPCGWVQHGKHTSHPALPVRFNLLSHSQIHASSLLNVMFTISTIFLLCFRFHFHGPCGTTLPPALECHEREQSGKWVLDISCPQTRLSNTEGLYLQIIRVFNMSSVERNWKTEEMFVEAVTQTQCNEEQTHYII